MFLVQVVKRSNNQTVVFEIIGAHLNFWRPQNKHLLNMSLRKVIEVAQTKDIKFSAKDSVRGNIQQVPVLNMRFLSGKHAQRQHLIH